LQKTDNLRPAPIEIPPIQGNRTVNID